MKKLIFIFSVCMTVIFFTRTMGQAPKYTDITVFFVDRYMHCLIPVNHSIPISSTQKQAEEIIKILSAPIKEDSSFVQYSSFKQDKINVKIQGETAVVDLSQKVIEIVPPDRENQQMFIYQIVNSLCSIPEIRYVKVIVDEESGENPLTFTDLREIFSSNYGI